MINLTKFSKKFFSRQVSQIKKTTKAAAQPNKKTSQAAQNLQSLIFNNNRLNKDPKFNTIDSIDINIAVNHFEKTKEKQTPTSSDFTRQTSQKSHLSLSVSSFPDPRVAKLYKRTLPYIEKQIQDNKGHDVKYSQFNEMFLPGSAVQNLYLNHSFFESVEHYSYENLEKVDLVDNINSLIEEQIEGFVEEEVNNHIAGKYDIPTYVRSPKDFVLKLADNYVNYDDGSEELERINELYNTKDDFGDKRNIEEDLDEEKKQDGEGADDGFEMDEMETKDIERNKKKQRAEKAIGYTGVLNKVL